MKRGWLEIVPLTLAVLLMACTLSCGQRATKQDTPLVVSFPDVHLAKDERIVGFTLTVTIGTIVSISNIQEDWSIHLDSDLSWQPKLSGICNHGVGALMSFRELPIVTIKPDHLSVETAPQFTIEGTVDTTVDFEGVETHSFQMADLVVRKEGA